MSISSVPFGFVFFPAVQATYPGSTFLLGSHELHTPRTNRLVVSSFLNLLFFFCENTQLFCFCFQCRHATRDGFVKSRRAHHQQPEEEERTRLFFVVFHLSNFFLLPPVDVKARCYYTPGFCGHLKSILTAL
jgi:hypothetical protein